MEPVTWDTLDWVGLTRLRERFLSGQPGGGSYWNRPSELASYDFTFGQRIRWKWEAVLRELAARGWAPPSGPLLDWGCGSGIAARCVLESFAPLQSSSVRFYDHSSLASAFATERVRASFPKTAVEPLTLTQVDELTAPGTVLISHVLNELTEDGGRQLRRVLDRADAILWVEPGTYADSRALIAMRESLRATFDLIAPCPHQETCGLLAEHNSRHWCHHFAAPPVGLLGNSNWVRFAQRAGIDLRRVPYSFLVLEKRARGNNPRPAPEGCLNTGWSRLLGEARVYKGFCKLLSCQAEGVRDLELQKRVAPEQFKRFKAGDAGGLWRFEVHDERIVKLTPFPKEPRPEPVEGPSQPD